MRVVRKRLRQREVTVLRQQIRAREGVEVVRLNRVEALVDECQPTLPSSLQADYLSR